MEMTEFEKLIRERYDHGQKMEPEEEGAFMAMLDGPFAFENEDEMLEYAKEHPEATVIELYEYWDSITPEGLAPGMDPEELLKDDDEE